VPERADQTEASEAAFIERLVAHDEVAFSELVRLYERRLFALVFRMLGRRDEAEEVTQEVFTQVFRSIHRFRGESKLSTWLFRVAVNLCKNRMKYHARRSSAGHQDLDSVADSSALTAAEGVSTGSVERPDELVEGLQLEVIIKKAFTMLEPEFRQLVLLRDVEDLSYEQIAEVTGLALGTVKSRIHRGRTQLRERVEEILGTQLKKARK